jgi:hypothetical protein
MPEASACEYFSALTARVEIIAILTLAVFVFPGGEHGV